MISISARDEKRNLVNAEKARGCLCCGESDPMLMESHHVDRTEKLFSISADKFKVSKEELVAEIAKCVTLCPTCHVYADRGVYTIEREDSDDDQSAYVCRRPDGMGSHHWHKGK